MIKYCLFLQKHYYHQGFDDNAGVFDSVDECIEYIRENLIITKYGRNYFCNLEQKDGHKRLVDYYEIINSNFELVQEGDIRIKNHQLFIEKNGAEDAAN